MFIRPTEVEEEYDQTYFPFNGVFCPVELFMDNRNGLLSNEESWFLLVLDSWGNGHGICSVGDFKAVAQDTHMKLSAVKKLVEELRQRKALYYISKYDGYMTYWNYPTYRNRNNVKKLIQRVNSKKKKGVKNG